MHRFYNFLWNSLTAVKNGQENLYIFISSRDVQRTQHQQDVNLNFYYLNYHVYNYYDKTARAVMIIKHTSIHKNKSEPFIYWSGSGLKLTFK